MGHFELDIDGLDAFGKSLTTFSDSVQDQVDLLPGVKPDTGRWAGHNSYLAQDPATTTAFQSHLATILGEIVIELADHGTFVGECVTAYNTSDTTASTTFALPPVPGTPPGLAVPGPSATTGTEGLS
jgi:hypothetical protein